MSYKKKTIRMVVLLFRPGQARPNPARSGKARQTRQELSRMGRARRCPNTTRRYCTGLQYGQSLTAINKSAIIMLVISITSGIIVVMLLLIITPSLRAATMHPNGQMHGGCTNCSETAPDWAQLSGLQADDVQ